MPQTNELNQDNALITKTEGAPDTSEDKAHILVERSPPLHVDLALFLVAADGTP